MFTSNRSRVRAAQSALVAGLLSLAVAAPALAGGCPADKVGKNPLSGAATAPVGVTEMELAYIDLSKESVNLPQRRLRYRHMEIQPGGIVIPRPILHKTGEIARESNGLMHWWKNEGNVVVVLTIADIVNDKKPDTMMPMM